MALDLEGENAPAHYFLTVSTKADMSAEQLAGLTSWHKLRTPCLLVREFRSDGVAHFHSVFGSKVKKANTVTLNLRRLFLSLHIPVQVGVTIKVKRAPHLVGMFHYLTKDLGDEKPLVLTGWKMSWIKQQCIDNVKNIPNKMLVKDDHFLKMRTAPGRILAYAKAKGFPIVDKDSYLRLCDQMLIDGFCFDLLKLDMIYGRVMGRLGDARAFHSHHEGKLAFMF